MPFSITSLGNMILDIFPEDGCLFECLSAWNCFSYLFSMEKVRECNFIINVLLLDELFSAVGADM